MRSTRHATLALELPVVRARVLVPVSYWLIALLACVPRLLDLGRFVTVDEIDHWLQRSEAFLSAIRTGNAAATAITAHPGVTTMWLGGVGLLLKQAASTAGLLPTASFARELALTQLPIALVNAGGIVFGYYLLRKLLPARTAALAALLWAADPFLVGYSRVLHVDALTATFATLSLLAACVYWHHQQQVWLLVVAGAGAALAVLSKSPGLAVLPVVAAVALARVDWRRALLPLGILCACCALTVLIVWPAVRSAPLDVVALVTSGVTENGGSPHSNGNFFLGESDAVPGFLFYPTVVAMRSTPITLIGLLLLPLAFGRLSAMQRRDISALTLLVLEFVLLLSLFPKQHNRYLVPAFPAIDILAAVGLMRLLDWRAIRTSVASTLFALVGIAAALNVAFWHPYEISAFNQLFGGAEAGAQTFLVGWGEGMEQAAAWLNEQPDITTVTTATTLKAPLGVYLRSGTSIMLPRTDLPEKIGYVVVYVRNVQGVPAEPPFDQFYGRVQPVHTVMIHGVPYVWIYQVAPTVAHAVSADFADTIRLRGYSLAQNDSNGAISVRLAWETLRVSTQDYAAFVHLIGPDGQIYAHVDPQLQTSQISAHSFRQASVQLQLPPQAPAGSYRVVVGVYTPNDGQRLALPAAIGANPRLDGPNAFVLATIDKP